MELYLIKTLKTNSFNGSRLKEIETECETKIITNEKDARNYFKNKIDEVFENEILYIIDEEELEENPDYFDEDGYSQDGYSFYLVKTDSAEISVWNEDGEGVRYVITIEKVEI